MIGQNNSGQDGTATLTERDGALEVSVTLRQSNFPGPQNSHIHTGRCDEVGPVAYGVSSKDEPKGTTTDGGTIAFFQRIANLKLSQLQGTHVINVHDARDNSLYVSCGEIK